ncbi:MAG: hypothetical protein ACFWTJ_02195 [Lachnoclostridium sp.]|jgi:hypothetical protein
MWKLQPKAKFKKLEGEKDFQYILDYDRVKNTHGFVLDLLTRFTENKNCLFVIDSDNLYIRKTLDMESKIAELKRNLQNQNISYKEIVTQKEAENKLLGIKIQSLVKVNSYKIALPVMPDPNQIKKVLELVKDYNLYYYIPFDETDFVGLETLFENGHGRFDELCENFKYILYNDSLFHRIRIISKAEINTLLMEITNKEK